MSASRGYMLAVLTALSALNQLDRQLVNILIEPIRREFDLTDVQIGLLSGLAFAAIYGVLSIPAALYAVHHNRKNLLALSATVWGGMTVICGLAQSYGQLLAARLGVGIGEAGGMPPSHAMISERYASHERAAALATWAAGVNIGIFLAFFGGGLIGQYYGWRTAFFSAGILTVALAVILQLTVKEPERTGDSRGGTPGSSRSMLAAVLRTFRTDRVLVHVVVGATLASTVGYSFLTWLPSFLIRSHGLGIAEAGIYIAITGGALGAIGTWLGGFVTERLQRRDVRWALWLTAATLVIVVPFAIFAFLTRSTWLALTLFAVHAALGAVFIGPSLAILHNRVEAALRPVTSAVFLLVVNCVGLALGPLGVGALSQYAFSDQGADSLRYALVAAELLALWASAHYFMSGARLRAKMRVSA
mgnify:CR=1 FL=1